MNEFPVKCGHCEWRGFRRGKPTQYPARNGRTYPGRCPECGIEDLRLDIQANYAQALTWPEPGGWEVDD